MYRITETQAIEIENFIEILALAKSTFSEDIIL
jgi:hypothetical protein